MEGKMNKKEQENSLSLDVMNRLIVENDLLKKKINDDRARHLMMVHTANVLKQSAEDKVKEAEAKVEKAKEKVEDAKNIRADTIIMKNSVEAKEASIKAKLKALEDKEFEVVSKIAISRNEADRNENAIKKMTVISSNNAGKLKEINNLMLEVEKKQKLVDEDAKKLAISKEELNKYKKQLDIQHKDNLKDAESNREEKKRLFNLKKGR